jgi:zinc transporter 1/2/3
MLVLFTPTIISVLQLWNLALSFIRSVSFFRPRRTACLTCTVIGITLNVTPDSFYTTLFVVILFHQMFEGLALGTRIASLQDSTKLWIKLLMATIFALITPIGMAIGAGVLSKFNGNDPSTIVAIGTLDALSAGILLWVGLVQMLAHDWMSGDMVRAGWVRAFVGITSLVVGLAIMSLLGKWA